MNFASLPEKLQAAVDFASQSDSQSGLTQFLPRIAGLRRSADDAEFELSFSPSDCHAYIILPIYNGDKLATKITERLGEVVLFSLSSHRDKFPVSRLGRILPIGFTAGRRTVAGTIAVVLWDRNAFRRLSQRLNMAYSHFTAMPHSDEMPPLDIVLVFVNEFGKTVSVSLYGVTILDEGLTIQSDDVRTVVTMSYMAVDYQIDHDPLQSFLPPRSTAPEILPQESEETSKTVFANRYEVNPQGRRPDLELSLVQPSTEPRLSVPEFPSSYQLSATQLDMDLLGEWVERPLFAPLAVPR